MYAGLDHGTLRNETKKAPLLTHRSLEVGYNSA